MPDPLADELDRLCAAAGFSRNPHWKTWAKIELLLGLTAAGSGVAAIVRGEETPLIAAGAILFALGFYLALAGHRSHLYQSNNRLAAYLASLHRGRPPHSPEASP